MREVLMRRSYLQDFLGLTLVCLMTFLPVALATAENLFVTNTASTGSSSPSVLQTIPLPSDERMLLDEYRLADKVESRVLSELKVYGAIFGLALAFIGFLGFQVIVDALTRRLEKTAKDDLEAIRTRTQTALVDLELAVREGRRTSDLAATQMETLRQRHSELEDLNAKYQELYAQVQAISKRAEEASNIAAASQEKSNSLGIALSNTFAGAPAIFMSSFDWNKSGTIGGTNFGKVPGKLMLTFVSRFIPLPGAQATEERMDPIEVSGNDIVQWSDTSITFNIPNDAMDKINVFRSYQEGHWSKVDPERKGDRTLGYKFVVERADGQWSKQ